MALNPASAAAAISAAYQDASGIDASGNPTGAMPAGNYRRILPALITIRHGRCCTGC